MGVAGMIRSGTINMIREKAREGKSAYAISKDLGVAENTARRYINLPVTEHSKGALKVPRWIPGNRRSTAC